MVKGAPSPLPAHPACPCKPKHALIFITLVHKLTSVFFISLYLSLLPLSNSHISLSPLSVSVSVFPLHFIISFKLYLWVSIYLCSLFLSSSLPSLCPFLLSSLLLMSNLTSSCTSFHCPAPAPPTFTHTHSLLYNFFTVPFLYLDIFRYTNTYHHSTIASAFSVITCYTSL